MSKKDIDKENKEKKQRAILTEISNLEEHTLQSLSDKLKIPKPFISTYLSQLIVERKVFSFRRKTENNTYVKIFIKSQKGRK